LKKNRVSSHYGRKHHVLLAFATGVPIEQPLVSASRIVNMISSATTANKPRVAIRARISNVKLVSICSKYLQTK
jgi:hypothetical protein